LPLAHEYHDVSVEKIDLGPRREVVLHVRLDPVWNNGDSSVRRLHFSAIQNFDEIEAFFAASTVPNTPDAAIDEVIGIVQPQKRVIGLDLARLGYVEFRGTKLHER